MIKIRFFSPGKIKDKWLDEALKEYTKRMSAIANFEYFWAKDEQQFTKMVIQEKCLICMDPLGQQMDSESFSAFFFQSVEKGGSTLSFAIGGPDGLSQQIKQGRYLLSLSKLTFTHQMARLILIEQIFRSFEIKKGSNYHK